MSRTVMLGSGIAAAIVSDEDYERVVAAGPWQLCQYTTGGRLYQYATRQVRIGSQRKTVPMHRFILNAHGPKQVDHINHDGLDNRRENLRLCTHGQNMANRRKRRGTSSQYRGVSLHKASGKWQAFIKAHGQMRYLGLFATEQDAALAYDREAILSFGEFATLNVKLEGAA